MEQELVSTLFLIFFGAALLSTAALFLHQSTLVAYMLLGAVVGPWGLKWVQNFAVVTEVGDVGIIFLLFLLGLHLPLQKLVAMLRKISSVGLISSLLFFVCGYAGGWMLGYTAIGCFVLGAALMFSSTIIGIKLLPTTILHHQHTGEVMISVLLFQDILAILVLLVLSSLAGGVSVKELSMIGLGFPVMISLAYLAERFVLRYLFARFNRVREYLFLLAIGWCLLMTETSLNFGLSAEIGGFIAGVSLAASPVSVYIAESLKPVRDFFLIMFFFSVGATLNLTYLPQIIIPAILFAALVVFAKPLVYKFLLKKVGEESGVAMEVGVRLGQISEFSLIIAYFVLAKNMVPPQVGYLIEAIAILTFAVSSYWVVMKYPTPLATQERLRRD